MRAPRRSRSRPLAAAVVVVGLAAAGCGGSSGSVPDPPAAPELLDQVAAAMSAVDTLRFELDRGGAPITVAGLEFDSAVGQYQAPASARALLKVKASGVSIELGTIAIDERVWLTNPLSGAWDEFPEGVGFNPAIIFDPVDGWPPLLTEDLTDPEVTTVDDLWRVMGIVAAPRVARLTAGLVEGQAVPVLIDVDPATFRIHNVEFSTSSPDGDSDWQLDLSDYDEPVSIEPPVTD